MFSRVGFPKQPFFNSLLGANHIVLSQEMRCRWEYHVCLTVTDLRSDTRRTPPPHMWGYGMMQLLSQIGTTVAGSMSRVFQRDWVIYRPAAF